jgi:hypothetical protein
MHFDPTPDVPDGGWLMAEARGRLNGVDQLLASAALTRLGANATLAVSFPATSNTLHTVELYAGGNPVTNFPTPGYRPLELRPGVVSPVAVEDIRYRVRLRCQLWVRNPWTGQYECLLWQGWPMLQASWRGLIRVEVPNWGQFWADEIRVSASDPMAGALRRVDDGGAGGAEPERAGD